MSVREKQPKICIKACSTVSFCSKSTLNSFFQSSCFAYSSRGKVPCRMNCGNNSFSFIMQKGIHFLINLKAFKYLEPENLTERNEMEQVQVKNLLVKQLDYTNNSIL